MGFRAAKPVWFGLCWVALVVARAHGVPAPSCGCQYASRQLATGSTTIQMTIGQNGTRRAGSYQLYLPRAANTDAPIPLFVVLHGFTSNPDTVAADSMMTTVADQLGVAVIFPRGLNNGPGRGWAFPGCNSVPNIGVTDVECDRTATCGPVGYAAGCRLSGCPSQAAFNENNGCGPQFTANATCLDPATNCNWCGCDDDLGFIRDVTKHAMAATCVDRAKVYLTGMSQGGMMASWLSARLGDIFAGFVPVSGTNPRGFFEYDSGLASSSSSLAVMPWRLWIHGRNDTTVPADGSPSAASDGTRWWYEPVVTEAATVAVRYSCNSTPTRNTTIEGLAGGLTPAEANLVCMEFGGCANGLRVAYCLWNGPHVWPSVYTPSYYPPSGVTKTTSDPFGSMILSQFMLEHQSGGVDRAAPSSCPPLSAWDSSMDDDLYSDDDLPQPHSSGAKPGLGLGAIVGLAAIVVIVVVTVGVVVIYRHDLAAKWHRRGPPRGAQVLHNDEIEMDNITHPSYSANDDDYLHHFDDEAIDSPTGYLDISISPTSRRGSVAAPSNDRRGSAASARHRRPSGVELLPQMCLPETSET